MAVWSELSNKIRRKGRRLTTEKKEKEENQNRKNKTNKTTQNKQNGENIEGLSDKIMRFLLKSK